MVAITEAEILENELREGMGMQEGKHSVALVDEGNQEYPEQEGTACTRSLQDRALQEKDLT